MVQIWRVKMAKKYSGVEQRGTSYRVIFMLNGIRRRETIDLSMFSHIRTLKDVYALRCEIQNKIKAGTFVYSDYFPQSKQVHMIPRNAAKNVYCSEILEKVLHEYQCIHDNGGLSISTFVDYRKIINNPLMPYFGRYLISEVTSVVIREFIESMGVSAKRIRNCLTIVRTMFALAQEMQLIKTSPLNELDVSRLLRVYGEKSKYNAEPFNESEKEIILANLSGQFKNLVQFAMWTGLRSSELIALRWGDVDLQSGFIHVRHAKVENTIKTTKTKSGLRKVIILPKACEALVDQQQYSLTLGEWVFHNPNTHRCWRDSTHLGNFWSRIVKTLPVKYRNFYQCRHTYASTLLSNGENVWFVATQMGHVDTEMLIKRYGKWIPQESAKGYEFKGKY